MVKAEKERARRLKEAEEKKAAADEAKKAKKKKKAEEGSGETAEEEAAEEEEGESVVDEPAGIGWKSFLLIKHLHIFSFTLSFLFHKPILYFYPLSPYSLEYIFSIIPQNRNLILEGTEKFNISWQVVPPF